MKLVLKMAIITIFFGLSVASAQSGANLIWSKSYGGDGGDYAREVQPLADGGFVVVGEYEWIEMMAAAIYVIRLDSDGDTIWTRLYSNGYYETGYSISPVGDSGFIIAGFINLPESNGHPYVLRIDENGDTLWSQVYADSSYGEARSIRPVTGGGYIVAGTIDSSMTGQTGYMFKIDSDGNQIWAKRYDIGRLNYFNSVRSTSDGGFILAGYGGLLGGGEMYVVKTDSVGDTVWTQVISEGNNAEGFDAEETIDGGIIIAGSAWYLATFNLNALLIKTDFAGNIEWALNYDSGENEETRSVKQTADGGYIGGGWTDYELNGYSNAWLIKVNSLGDTIWTEALGGEGYEAANSMGLTSNGNFILAGSVSTDEIANNVYLVLASEAAPGECEYVQGDINGDGQRLGADVTYGVRYFKGTGPCPPDSCFVDSTGTYLYVAGDANGNCEFRGSDITRLVAYFKGAAALGYCHFFPTPY